MCSDSRARARVYICVKERARERGGGGVGKEEVTSKEMQSISSFSFTLPPRGQAIDVLVREKRQ